MRVVVTGASGFVGRQVVRVLLERGVEVTAVTRSAERLAESGGAVRVVEMDLARAPENPVSHLGPADRLIHLAWDGLPNYFSTHHFEHELVNHYRFLKGCVAGGIDRLVVAGTCFEYGLSEGALAEDRTPRPVTTYGFAKDALRRQLEFLRKDSPFTLSWPRMFYLHGEGQSPNSLLGQLRAAVERGEREFPMSGGEQLRDYLPIGEAAELLVALTLRGGDDGAVNLCSGRPISVRRLVEEWIEARGWDIRPALGHYPYPTYEPMAFWGERTKLDRLLEAQ